MADQVHRPEDDVVPMPAPIEAQSRMKSQCQSPVRCWITDIPNYIMRNAAAPVAYTINRGYDPQGRKATRPQGHNGEVGDCAQRADPRRRNSAARSKSWRRLINFSLLLQQHLTTTPRTCVSLVLLPFLQPTKAHSLLNLTDTVRRPWLPSARFMATKYVSLWFFTAPPAHRKHSTKPINGQ